MRGAAFVRRQIRHYLHLLSLNFKDGLTSSDFPRIYDVDFRADSKSIDYEFLIEAIKEEEHWRRICRKYRDFEEQVKLRNLKE